MPKIAAIIPAFNAEIFLAEAIESIINQSAPVNQVIVADDGSTDSTAKVAKSFPGVNYQRQENQGPPSARNLGLSLVESDTDFLAFCDADDKWVADKIERLLEVFEEQPSTSIALGQMQYFYESPLTPPQDALHQVEPHLAYSTGACLFRRSALLRLEGFDPTLIHHDDWDLFMRAKDLKMNIATTEACVYYARRHGGNLTNDRGTAKAFMLKMARQRIQRLKKSRPPVAAKST